MIDAIRSVVFANMSAPQFGHILLRANGLLLSVVGAVASVADLAGHFLGLGPHGARLFGDPGTLRHFEAHALAIIVGVVLFRCAPRADNAGHLLGAAVHGLLGASNLMFWASAEHYLRTLFTWRTDYVLDFPSWYSLVILPLLIGLTISVLKLDFDGREPSPA